MAQHFLGRSLEPWARQKPLVRQALWWGEASLVRLLLAGCRGLGPDAASAAGERLGRLLGPKTYKHRHVLANLAIAFPDADEAWRERTARQIWGNFGRVLAEFAFLRDFVDGRYAERIELVDRGGLGVVASRQPAILVTAHLANWEFSLRLPARFGFALTAVYAAQSNPYLDRLLARYRQQLPVRFVAVADAARELPRALARGECLGLLIDQRFDGGELVPFFGRLAPTAVAPARLAVRFGVPFIPLRVERLDGARFRISVFEPLAAAPDLRDHRQAALELTARVNRLFEEWIRERPGEWLCAKRRWPKGPDDRKLRQRVQQL
jgi:KDO2-lipid IV(A) lauroyltransferase